MNKKRNNILIFIIFIISICFIYSQKELIIKDFNDYFNNSTSLKKGNESISKLVFNGSLIDNNEIKKLKDSGITTTTFISNKEYYPYYEMLTDNEKKLYGQIYENAKELQTTFVPLVKITKDEFKTTVEAVYNDHPEFFWLNTDYSYKYIGSNRVVQIILSFNYTTDNFNESKYIFDNNVNYIVNEANKYNTYYEKEKFIHDYLINKVSYNKDALINQSAYSAIVNNSSVCAGYARAFQLIMNKLNIPTYYVTGYSNGEHAWNIVKLNGGYYNVDVTWDDKDVISYKYFNITDNDIFKTHKRRGLSNYLEACNSNEFSNLENEEIDNYIIDGPQIENDSEYFEDDLIDSNEFIVLE